MTGEAFGAPGMTPGWTHSNKSAIGTAYSTSSSLWFTMWKSIITEVSFPTIDRPQLRDLQYLISDGSSFFHEEKRDLTCEVERISDVALGYHATSTGPQQRYVIRKDVIASPHLPCLLQRTRLTAADPALLETLRLYVLCAPHLNVGGHGNNGYVKTVNGKRLLMAQKGHTWLALGATVPYAKTSCGFAGASDGWTDLHQNFQMDWQFETATNGNIALTGELDLSGSKDFVLGLAFGDTEHSAMANLLQSLALPFDEQLATYQTQWERASSNMTAALAEQSFDAGHLFRRSCSLLLAHEDKSYAGALIASLTIPWGEAKGDDDTGGYHLVWTRDLVSSATALLAAGDSQTALRALIFLAVSQHPDGGFAQNFWVDGTAYWNGTQLDEVAMPMMLAWKLRGTKALDTFDPSALARAGAAFLIRNGPVTQQERWEEVSGYSPSTLASNIVALTGAATFFRDRGDAAAAKFTQDHADYLEAHIEEWTVTTTGSLGAGTPGYYMRILPETLGQANPAEEKESRMVHIANRAPDEASEFPARDIVDGGFLELVRHGIRAADHPVVVNTLAIIDRVLKVDTPAGPTWHRYNYDGYGQQRDGSAFTSYGVGRVWPLLSGERGHYEIAAGRSPATAIRTLEGLAMAGLITEQSWDEADLPEMYMRLGEPTGAAMPLMWAHAEYVKLLRSASDGKVFDQFPEVAERYLSDGAKTKMEVWSPSRPVRFMHAGEFLRVLGGAPFRLRWSADGWVSVNDTGSARTSLEIDYVDLEGCATTPGMVIEFTFFWLATNTWEGRNHGVTVTVA
jgi:glucoamylase